MVIRRLGMIDVEASPEIFRSPQRLVDMLKDPYRWIKTCDSFWDDWAKLCITEVNMPKSDYIYSEWRGLNSYQKACKIAAKVFDVEKSGFKYALRYGYEKAVQSFLETEEDPDRRLELIKKALAFVEYRTKHDSSTTNYTSILFMLCTNYAPELAQLQKTKSESCYLTVCEMGR